MVVAGELQALPASASLVVEGTGQRQASPQAIRIRLDAAPKAGELPAATDIVTLSAFFAMSIQGVAIQARDGAKPALLKRLAQGWQCRLGRIASDRALGAAGAKGLRRFSGGLMAVLVWHSRSISGVGMDRFIGGSVAIGAGGCCQAGSH